MEFKVGDKVKKIDEDCETAKEGKNYVVTKCTLAHCSLPDNLIIGDELTHGGGCHCQNAWELVTNKNTMKKLNQMMKKLLDSNTKKFIKAGFINGDLELTDEGQEALNAILLEKYSQELLVLAEEQIKEDKEKS